MLVDVFTALLQGRWMSHLLYKGLYRPALHGETSLKLTRNVALLLLHEASCVHLNIHETASQVPSGLRSQVIYFLLS